MLGTVALIVPLLISGIFTAIKCIALLLAIACMIKYLRK